MGTRCVIQQYGNYSVDSLGIKLNGITTQGENIADNGGIKEAYRAYQRFEERHGTEKRLPGLSMNPKQLFWMTAANVWCSKYRPKSLESRVRRAHILPECSVLKAPFLTRKNLLKISIVL